MNVMKNIRIKTSTSRVFAIACLTLALVATGGQAADPIANLFGGVSSAVNDLAGGVLGATGLAGGYGGAASGVPGQVAGLGGVLPNVLNQAGNVVNGVARPVFNLLGSIAGGPNGLGGAGNLIGDTIRSTSGALNGLAAAGASAAGAGLAAGPSGPLMGGYPNFNFGPGLHNAYKREAIANNLQQTNENAAIEAGAQYGAPIGPAGAAAAVGSMAAGNEFAPAANMIGAQGLGIMNPASIGHAAANAAGMIASAGQAAGAANIAASAINGLPETALAVNNLANSAIANLAPNQLPGRALLAGEALRNAQSESALAGADMVAHGANNARSASLASNAYRQAKLASARDRVNVAGTIQNSARISDAAIATHDAATRAEDSLLGSELAVDSASTVLDSDGAYIPPVTSSLLRSLPYGRLGIRNIVPKPLTYPSFLLPDVWLNGVPVNYLNVPLRMLPYPIGPTGFPNPLWQSGAALANGPVINGQPFIANNGMLINGMVIDPALAYISGGLAAAGFNALASSSILPVLANGQLEAQDEVAAANLITMQQLGGAGMSSTYQGYGRLNPVPLITGSVSDANLLPATTIGTTYPIGSALVIEPRDSYFQDYVDNASSRQNFDEREQ